MIAKVTVGTSASAAASYDLDNEIDGHADAQVLGGTVAAQTPDGITQEFARLHVLRPELRKGIIHCSLRLAPGEHLSSPEWLRLSERFMEGMGFSGGQYIAIQHASHHIHILANRVLPDGRVVSDTCERWRANRIVQELETTFRLRHAVDPRRNAHLDVPLTHDIVAALDACDGTRDRLDAALAAQGITATWHLQDDHIVGVRFERDGYSRRGSKLPGCSGPCIERVLGERRAAVQAAENRSFEMIRREHLDAPTPLPPPSLPGNVAKQVPVAAVPARPNNELLPHSSVVSDVLNAPAPGRLRRLVAALHPGGRLEIAQGTPPSGDVTRSDATSSGRQPLAPRAPINDLAKAGTPPPVIQPSLAQADLGSDTTKMRGDARVAKAPTHQPGARVEKERVSQPIPPQPPAAGLARGLAVYHRLATGLASSDPEDRDIHVLHAAIATRQNLTEVLAAITQQYDGPLRRDVYARRVVDRLMNELKKEVATRGPVGDGRDER